MHRQMAYFAKHPASSCGKPVVMEGRQAEGHRPNTPFVVISC